MIHVTCGHEKGIGLEVFLKSFILLTKSNQKEFILYTSKKTLSQNLANLNLKYKLDDDQLEYSSSSLLVKIFKESDLPQSTQSLELALTNIGESDILFTLPTSKDQLIEGNSSPAGYTEFLRKRFKISNLIMTFDSDTDLTALITDHIPLKDISTTIGQQLIQDKISIFIDSYQKYFNPVEEIILSGINPHVGENGILGIEDKVIYTAVENLKEEYPKINFIGPVSGDTLHFHRSPSKKQASIYMYHDQGLGIFKSHNHTIGANITLGLPFLRLSVDHGTAFELYGKNKANIQGCFFCLKKSLKAHKKLRS